jgi:hypothetical protein
MSHYSFVRLADNETIPIVAESVSLAVAILSQRERVSLSLEGQGDPAYVYSKSDQHTFWCRPNIPVYVAIH